MTINNTQNYNLDGISSARDSALQKVATGLLINQASDNASGLAIADQLRTESGGLRQAIENINSGIAMSNIAQGAMDEQTKILENIKTETLKAMNGTTSQEGIDAIANQLDKYIEQFDAIAQQTNYNGKQLLTTSGDPVSDDLSVSTEDSTISLSSADTTSISDSLKTLMTDFRTNPDSRSAMLEAVDNGMSDLSSMQSSFASASNAMESSARTYLNAQTNIENAQSVIRDLDYANGIANFNKTDLQAQIGSLIQSQANAVQSRVVSLLS